MPTQRRWPASATSVSAARSGSSLASCGCVPTVCQMSGWLSEIARTAGSCETRSQIVTIRPTPAARARSITASRSAANCGACRFTWLSISI